MVTLENASCLLCCRELNFDSPRVGGACRLDGVDPELVGEVLQALQGFLVGFVVVSHAFRVTGELRPLQKLIQSQR